MRFDMIRRYAVGVALVGGVALAVSCGGDDDPVATGGSVSADALATYTGTSTTGAPTPPTLPLTASIEFGVESDPPDPTTDYPEPMLFGDHVMVSGDRVTHDTFDTEEFPIVAERLTDGIDEGVFIGQRVPGAISGGSGGIESSILDYPPTLSRTGPDLEGYVVTSIDIVIDELTTSEAGGIWTTRLRYTLTIRGRAL